MASAQPAAAAEPLVDMTDTAEEDEKGHARDLPEEILERLYGVQRDVTELYEKIHWNELKIPAAVALAAIVATGNVNLLFYAFVYPLYWLILRIIAIALGVALGLGFATHVYDQLEHWTRANREVDGKEGDGDGSQSKQQRQPTLLERSVNNSNSARSSSSRDAASHTKTAPSTNTVSSKSFDPNDASYASLLASAGYDVDANIKRGQVLRQLLPLNYPFCHVPRNLQYGPMVMQQEWPNLPTIINQQLGYFIEYVMRDYVSTWYSMVDGLGVQYPHVVQKQKDKAAALERGEEWNETIVPPKYSTYPLAAQPPHLPSDQQQLHPNARVMVFSTAAARSLPLLEHFYRSLSVIFGNLAHRVKDVNVFQLLLLKWTKVIAHTFKIYRQLRQALLDKQTVHERKAAVGAGAVARSIVRRAGNLAQTATGGVNRTISNTLAGESDSNNPPATSATSEMTTTTNINQQPQEPPRRQDSLNSSFSNINSEEGGEGNASTTKGSTPGKTRHKVSEMAMAKEFLVTGRLHPACTFGLEVPSLLFADATGKECGTGTKEKDTTTNDDASTEDTNDADNNYQEQTKTEEQVLEERLFGTPLLYECEVDYNRVLSSRIVRLLVPRQDLTSPILSSLLTEIMAGCVLSPMMSVFSPDYLNDWIQKGVAKLQGTEEEASVASNTADGATKPETETPSRDVSATLEHKEVEDDASTTSSKPRATPPKPPPEQALTRTWTGAEGDIAALSEDQTSLAPTYSYDGDELDGGLDGVMDTAGQEELGELMDLSAKKINISVDELAGADESDSLGGSDDNEITTDEEDEEDLLDEDAIMMMSNSDQKNQGIFPMITLLHMAIMNLQRHLDLDECRESRLNAGCTNVEIDWDDPECREAVLRLVLVVEALLLHGRRATPVPPDRRAIGDKVAKDDNGPGTADEEGATPLPASPMEEFNATKYTQILMDLTSDTDAFETLHVTPYEAEGEEDEEDAEVTTAEEETNEKSPDNDYAPSPTDLSTLRTLISAWLHTGEIFRTIGTLVKAKTTVVKPYYHSYAFLRHSQTASALTRQLKVLDGVDIMVDTVAILSSPQLNPIEEVKKLLEGGDTPNQAVKVDNTDNKSVDSGKSTPTGPGQRFKGLIGRARQEIDKRRPRIADGQNAPVPPPNTDKEGEDASAAKRDSATSTSTTLAQMQMQQQFQAQVSASAGTPRYLQYHQNQAFAISLRSERERRMKSWITSIQKDTEMLQIVCRSKGSSPEEVAYHRELHHIARIFYAGTNLVAIRDAARSNNSKQTAQQGDATPESEQSVADEAPEVSLLTVEMACSRRRIEVPDDDSSFLLRAQPRLLNSIGVHRDTRNADLSYRCFAGTYEEPAVLPGTNQWNGGRYIRRCLIRYYPSDRTAAVALQNDDRKLDQRKRNGSVQEPNQTPGGQRAPAFSSDFLKKRHLCQKWIPKGSTSRSQPGMLSSNVMEQSDFTAAPRTGKALDFVYRMSLFEKPMIDLGGKRFTCHDSSMQSAHRADASALEISDAALSAALMAIGRDFGNGTDGNDGEHGSDQVRYFSNKVEMGPDGYPICWMKYSRKQSDAVTSTEIKPYRVSFIRAALLITSARQEAQLQCLVKCVQAGSAKSATKARTDAQLRPTLRLLDYARNQSREKQGILLRDLKLGINHIDREQLRRNALLSPRYPTLIQDVTIFIEKAMPARDANVKIVGNPQMTVFKIRCVATLQLNDDELPKESLEPYLTEEGKKGYTYRETWAVYRPFKDFQALHKHLKNQVANSESSGNAGTRLVGVAAAAFNAGNAPQQGLRDREALIPSLGQANKAVALGVTQRAISKRKEVLDGYLRYLLSPGHPLNRSPELLLFVGAFFPLPPEVRVGKAPMTLVYDPLGRAEMTREVVQLAEAATSPAWNATRPSGTRIKKFETNAPVSPQKDMSATSSARSVQLSAPSIGDLSERSVDDLDHNEQNRKNAKSENIKMNPAIEQKIDKVPLGLVRNRIFELLTYQFGFENASFFRSRLLSALKTASFAFTTPGEFKRTLYKAHVENVSPEALAGWIDYGMEMLWPDGVFFESAPAMTPEEQEKQAAKARELLHSNFPDQLKTVLGGELTRDGLDMLHEMLQNRIVVKSLAYMLFDLLWQEVFPEMSGLLPCGEALDIESETNK